MNVYFDTGSTGRVRDGGLRRCVLGITDIMGDAGEGEPQGECVPKKLPTELVGISTVDVYGKILRVA